MATRDNILKELNELESSLSTASASNPYQVPAGYFEGLAGQIIDRIRAAESESDELPGFLAGYPRVTPYQVPSGYFNGLEEKLIRGVLEQETDLNPTEELESLSPLLSSLKKEMPYSLPANYFESLAPIQGTDKKAKVISMGSRKWFRYAAAAVIIGLISMTTFLLLNNNQQVDPDDKSYAWVKKNLNKVSTMELDSFINLAEQETPAIASVNPANEVKDLIKNIPDEEIQDFLNDAQDADAGLNNDILLN